MSFDGLTERAQCLAPVPARIGGWRIDARIEGPSASDTRLRELEIAR